MTNATKLLQEARDRLTRDHLTQAGGAADFRWPVLDRFNFARDWFDVIAAQRDREALRIIANDGTAESHLFSELAAASRQVANLLADHGLKRGDTVLLMLNNVAPLWVTMLAAMRIGAIIIPAAPLLSAAEISSRLARGNVRFVVADSGMTDRFTLSPDWTGVAVGNPVDGWIDYHSYQGYHPDFETADTAATDPLLLYFTSGTTSEPKLVQHSHQSYPVGHLSTMHWIGLRPGDVHMNISSPGWAKHAWSCVFAPWLAEATVLVTNWPRFDAAALNALLEREKVTTFCAPPTVWRMLIQQQLGARPASLRELASAGEPLNAEVIDQVEKAWGLLIRDGFGQTETSALIGNAPGTRPKPGAMGRPLPGYEIVLLNADGEPAEEGEICVKLSPDRPLGIMQGYRVDGKLVPTPADYHRTGDIAMRDADGVITHVGRTDDVFKSSDYRISPFELESVLIEHPAVAEAAVVPYPDPQRLALPKAIVTLADGHEANADTARSILKHAREALGPFKRVRILEVGDLPKTISGKIRRAELKKLEIERQQSGERPALEWRDDQL